MEGSASKPVERTGPGPEPASRDDVKIDASPTRCPFCHDGVDTHEAGWVACGGCMARHHAACWDERGACSSCGGVRRLVAEDRQPATDPEVVALVRAGDRPRAQAELRARGLDERASRAAVNLVAAALAARGESDVGWSLAAVTYGLQTVALLVAAVIAANSAEGGAFSGLAVMWAAALALGLSAWVGRKGGSRPLLAMLAVVNVVVTGLGPMLIVGLDIPSYGGSVVLCLLALALAAGSAALTCLSVVARRAAD